MACRGSVGWSLDNCSYCSLKDFENDCALVWKNALSFNAPGSFVHNKATELRKNVLHNIQMYV